MGPQRRFKPQLETLDDRTLMSVSASVTPGGILRVTGTQVSDEIRVTMPTPNQLRVQVGTMGESQTFSTSAVTSVQIRPRGVENLVVFATKLTMPAEVRVWTGNSTIVSAKDNDVVVIGTGKATLVSEVGTQMHSGKGKTALRGTNAADQQPRIFEVKVEKLKPNTIAVVFVDGVAVGRMRIDSQGRGELRYDSTLNTFPASFPKIHYGSVVTIQVDGFTVARTYTNP